MSDRRSPLDRMIDEACGIPQKPPPQSEEQEKEALLRQGAEIMNTICNAVIAWALREERQWKIDNAYEQFPEAQVLYAAVVRLYQHDQAFAAFWERSKKSKGGKQ